MNKILLITEGTRPDKTLVEKLLTFYKEKKESIDYCIVEYKTNIHMLYEHIKEEYGDDIEDISIIPILSEKNSDFQYKKDDFSEIYLFFDYDIHHYMFSEKLSIEKLNEHLQEMLYYFNNETGDLGKLYINYPMVESFFIDESKEIEINSLKAYKQSSDINKNKGKFLQKPESFLEKNSDRILRYHVKIETELVKETENYSSYRDYQEITQLMILKMQLDKYVCKNLVRELSTLPRFIIEYFGERLYKRIV